MPGRLPRSFHSPAGSISQVQSTRVPPSTGVNVYHERPVPPHGALMSLSATFRLGSSSVTSITFSMVPPNGPFVTARRRLPMPGGPGVMSSASIALADHFGDCVGSVRTAKTSSTGRAMVTLTSVRPILDYLLPCAIGVRDLGRRYRWPSCIHALYAAVQG